jgi:hypothetical protein
VIAAECARGTCLKLARLRFQWAHECGMAWEVLTWYRRHRNENCPCRSMWMALVDWDC